jgi:hypothetical protein
VPARNLGTTTDKISLAGVNHAVVFCGGHFEETATDAKAALIRQRASEAAIDVAI